MFDPPTWLEAQYDAWTDAVALAEAARARGDHVAAAQHQQEADRLADEAWRRTRKDDDE